MGFQYNGSARGANVRAWAARVNAHKVVAAALGATRPPTWPPTGAAQARKMQSTSSTSPWVRKKNSHLQAGSKKRFPKPEKRMQPALGAFSD